jgi:hypothetical protein
MSIFEIKSSLTICTSNLQYKPYAHKLTITQPKCVKQTSQSLNEDNLVIQKFHIQSNIQKKKER